MTVDPDLLELLACPSDDHAPLRQEAQALVCTFCLTSYPIDADGIAVLLRHEATPGPNGIGVAAAGR
ncbi:MAG TPA: Trm112 family protein [Jatrophihabitantaceae bacterium]|nr:Trm112 family protein [Jatrophihabitantaceae bacterium]